MQAVFIIFLHKLESKELFNNLHVNSLRGLSPRANYTDRAAAAGRRS